MNVRHQGHTDTTPLQLGFDMPEILSLVERGGRDAHDLTTGFDQLDRFGHSGSRIHGIADGHRLDANRIVPSERHVPNVHDTGLAATVSKGIVTVCGQRDHGGPFAVNHPSQSMTGACIGCTELAFFLQESAILGTLLRHLAKPNMLQCRPVALPGRGQHGKDSRYLYFSPHGGVGMGQMALTFICSVAGLAFAIYLAKWVLQNDEGTKEMQNISDAIREGAEAFLARQYKTIAYLTIPVAVVIWLLYALRQSSGQEHISTSQLAWYVAGSFIFGAICSGIAGYVGMWVAIRSNIRTAAASRTSLNLGLQIALRGGAVSGLFVVVMSLLGVGGLFTLLRLFGTAPTQIPFLIVGYGFGASFVALFAHLGGGIYTKAADVGADLVGKVEAGIPEDDPRNPAVIADLVGANVGACAGRGADLFESTPAENIGAMVLGVAWFPYFGIAGTIFPLVARSFGLLAS